MMETWRDGTKKQQQNRERERERFVLNVKQLFMLMQPLHLFFAQCVLLDTVYVYAFKRIIIVFTYTVKETVIFGIFKMQ